MRRARTKEARGMKVAADRRLLLRGQEGDLLLSAAAVGVGVLLAHLRYGTVDVAKVPLSHDHPLHYFTQAAPVFFGPSPLQVACTLLLPAATAALVYAVPAAATARDDLGGYPSIEAVFPQAESATATTS